MSSEILIICAPFKQIPYSSIFKILDIASIYVLSIAPVYVFRKIKYIICPMILQYPLSARVCGECTNTQYLTVTTPQIITSAGFPDTEYTRYELMLIFKLYI